MKPSRHVLPAMALVVLLGACASSGTGSATSASRNVLTREDLLQTNAPSLYDAIRRLRPRWLRPRGYTSTGQNEAVPVYRNNVRAGGLDYLVTVQVEAVEEVRYISASDATTRWGTGHAGGAIEVIMR